MVANDYDNSLVSQVHSLPLAGRSRSAGAGGAGKTAGRVRGAGCGPPGSGRSSFGGAGVPDAGRGEMAADAGTCQTAHRSRRIRAAAERSSQGGPEMAVVNLTGSFAASHPSGLETETLTVLSICGTLHANLPQVTEVRFLVDGKPRPSLAGHADLTRTYLVSSFESPDGGHEVSLGNQRY